MTPLTRSFLQLIINYSQAFHIPWKRYGKRKVITWVNNVIPFLYSHQICIIHWNVSTLREKKVFCHPCLILRVDKNNFFPIKLKHPPVAWSLCLKLPYHILTATGGRGRCRGTRTPRRRLL